LHQNYIMILWTLPNNLGLDTSLYSYSTIKFGRLGL
jgi:hypothetical protein